LLLRPFSRTPVSAGGGGDGKRYAAAFFAAGGFSFSTSQ
jgi:hypothetical protein